MTNEIVTTTDQEAAIIESVVIGGDLSKLSAAQRVTYYRQVCGSMGLNYLTRPFDYITLNGKLTLYARKDAADQLRKINSVSIGKPDIQFVDDLILVTVEGEDKTGRKDAEVGVVKKGDMQGNLPNAIMKAVTKAKRRLTLSLCGLGWLDETEVETIPGAHVMPAEIVDAEYTEPVTAQPPTNGNSKPAPRKPSPASAVSIPQALVDAGVFEDIASASVTLNKMPNDTRHDLEKALTWARIYRGWREVGKPADEAAQLTNDGQQPA